MSQEKSDMEMIIIKRGHPHEDHPHGGAWKVAFADFMTAMFAFFLVLWIVNSTNKETRSSVARYFNPIRISDTTPARKGLKDPKEADFDAAAADEKAKPKTGTLNDVDGQSGPGAANGGRPSQQDAPKEQAASSHGWFDPVATRDPFVVLDEIAGTSRGASAADGMALSSEVDLLGDGPIPFRDPFAPASPVVPPEAKPLVGVPGRTAPPPAVRRDAKTGARPVAEAKQAAGPDAPVEAAAAQMDAAQDPARTPDGKAPETKLADAKPAAADKPLTPAQSKAQAAAQAKQSAAEAGVLKKQISDALNAAGLSQGPKLDVHAVDEGVLISLTDDLNFGMFKVGSAEPQPEVVRAMERIGQILKAQAGMFIIRGHTDGRPFRTPAYDNWRLSSARAQMAAYMLIRGSLEEKRIERIEGHADRSLRVANDPNAAQNRRIEILLRRPK
ncbi:MAG: MotB family protein [Beijerinckiaceae bacterium]|nr:MotB family protein [Beijerinckiaceae bacterium]